MHGIQYYDVNSDVLKFICPVCEYEEDYDLSQAEIMKMHPTERSRWGLCIGNCPKCNSSHHLNLNLPDSHEHAEHINAILIKKHGPDLPLPTLK